MKLRIFLFLIVLGITMTAVQCIAEEICSCVNPKNNHARIVDDESECRGREEFICANCITCNCDGELSEDGRWCDQKDGTVKDMTTCLVWLQNANCIETDYPDFDTDGTSGDGMVIWQHALDYVADMNSGVYPGCAAGYTDWRLPTIKEFESLIDFSQYDPALPINHPFSNVQSSAYYSSSSYAPRTSHAWHIGIDNGYVNGTSKDNWRYVWPVRSGN